MSKIIGNRIFNHIHRPDAQLIQAYRGLPASNINDEMGRLYCMNSSIGPLNDVVSMVGTAFTVKAPAGDNLMFHQALDMAQPGDIIVVDGSGDMNRALAGEIMMRFASLKGIAGIVVDGCLRDLDGIRNLSMPVYAKGVTPQGPYKAGPGEINVPVVCGGQVVLPGDILVGDADGIVVIRQQDALDVLAAAVKKKASEDKTFETMEQSFEVYVQKHLNSTAKRMEGKGTTVLNNTYWEAYKL